MKTATVRQIRNAFPTVLQMVKNGETVAITSRRKVVATLTPPPAPSHERRRYSWTHLDDRLAELRQQPILKETGADLIGQDRDRY